MKKLWGIRHIRWLWLRYHAEQWALEWYRFGLGTGHIHKSDEDYLNEVWRGLR